MPEVRGGGCAIEKPESLEQFGAGCGYASYRASIFRFKPPSATLHFNQAADHFYAFFSEQPGPQVYTIDKGAFSVESAMDSQ